MHFLKNWSRVDFFDFFDKEYKNNILDIEKYDLVSLSLEYLALNYLHDFFLFSENRQLQIIEFIVNKLDEEEISKVSNKKRCNNYELAIKIFKENRQYFLNFLNIKVSQIEKQTVENYSIKEVKVAYPLRSYQIDCCRKINNLKNTSVKRALLHLPTGAGKTRTAINFVCEYLRQHPKTLVVWLADTVELCDQARNEFDKAWAVLGNCDLNSFAFYGKNDISLGGINSGFLVAGLQKFRAENATEERSVQLQLSEFMSKVGLVVFDEAHKALANTYKTLTENIISYSEKDCFLLGLSATPGRGLITDADDETKKLSELFDNQKVNMDIDGYRSPIEFLMEKKYLAKPTFEIVNYDRGQIIYDLFHQDSEQFVNKVLAHSDKRNLAIIDTIKKQFEKNETTQIILFACSVQHAKELEIWINGIGIIAKAITGSTDSEFRQDYIERFKDRQIRVLINYGVLTAGFDAPCTDCVLITRPTNSLIQYLQMAGRAMRGPASGGNEACMVYTVNDELEEFKNMFKAFSYWDSNWA